MTIGQGWCGPRRIDPKETPSELTASEPYIMGSHATCSGAWASGPEDCAPAEYQWGYNRMTTVEGLFGAGDTIGGSAHKFSAGSFVEGRLAGKAAVRYVMDMHQLQRAWELQHRILTAESVTRHTLFKKETRWPGYYYRADHPKLDDSEWHCFTGSKYDPKTREWSMSKLPVHRIVEGFELLRA